MKQLFISVYYTIICMLLVWGFAYVVDRYPEIVISVGFPLSIFGIIHLTRMRGAK